jgi:hypothetical protein
MKPMNTLKLLSIATFASTSMFFTSCGEKKDAETEANNEAQKAEASTAAQQAENTLDSLFDELIVQFNEAHEAVRSATDKASAEESAKQILIIADEIESIAARLDKLETSSEEEVARCYTKMSSYHHARAAHYEKMAVLQPIINSQEVEPIMGRAMAYLERRTDKLTPFFEHLEKKFQAPDAPYLIPLPAAE